ncbi:MAG: hypothetical protein PV362_18830, partial [Providencia heimbachae]|nr:hypothetical protein [Providencia heimbachae]
MSDNHTTPTAESVKLLYDKLWGTAFNGNIPPTNGTPTSSLLKCCPIITPERITARVKRLNSKSAAGPSNIVKADITRLRGTDTILAKFFNLICLTGHYPRSWKICRTTLISKKGKDPSQAANWRPITIAPMLARLFSGLIDSGLRNHIVLNRRQKGFTLENGCFNNIFALGEIIKKA